MVLLVVLTSAVTLLLVTKQAPKRKPESSQEVVWGPSSTTVTQSTVIGASLAGLETCSSPGVEAALSNDQDHDGKPDGMADPLAMLLCAFVALLPYVVLALYLVGELLLRFCESSILVGSDYYPALERPG